MLVSGLVIFIGYQVWPIIRVVWISFTDYQFLTDDPAKIDPAEGDDLQTEFLKFLGRDA